MRVAGAIDDQNTFTLDGIDVTDNIVAAWRRHFGHPTGSGVSGGIPRRRKITRMRHLDGPRVDNICHRQGWHEPLPWLSLLGPPEDFLNANEWELNRINLPRPVIGTTVRWAVGGPI